MKKIILLLLAILPLFLLAQTDLAGIKRGSHFTLVYKISAKDAIQYYHWDSIPVNKFLEGEAYMQFNADSIKEDLLPIGFYVFVKAVESNLVTTLYNKTNLISLAVNNKHRLQLDIRTQAGVPVPGTTVFINDKPASYNKNSGTFWMQQKFLEDADVFIYSPGDTMITEITAMDNLYRSVKEQLRINFRSSLFYKTITWVPSKISSVTRKKRKPATLNFPGYMVFNKPKYKPLDTVRFKACLVDQHWKQYRKPVDVFLSYYSRGKNNRVFIKKLKPESPAAYTDMIVLGDSIPPDNTCTITFLTGAKKQILSQTFRVEEYVLDEIGTQTFQSDKEIYYRNDSMVFTATAKDANGLHVMDASARLVLTTSAIDTFFNDRVFIPDTLYNEEVKMSTTGDTKFVIKKGLFPAANTGFAATLVFKNSNNELQYKTLNLNYKYESKKIIVTQQEDSLKIVYQENGIERPGKGTVQMNLLVEENVDYPLMLKINPLAEEYVFKLETDNDLLKESYDVSPYYEVSFSRISDKDTLGFVLDNPYEVPVYYTVLNGNDIVTTGQQSGRVINWKKKMDNRRQYYKVRWQYYWGGKEKTAEEGIGLLYKLLKIQVDRTEKIFPGQEDSVKIKVLDYKGRPAGNVNLTAASYNNQFKDLSVKEPPYLVKYKSKRGIERDGFESGTPGETVLMEKYLLGKNKYWMQKLGLDTMEYYKLLFPPAKYYDAVRYTHNRFIPQLSVNVVDKGVPQEIYLLYINNELVYYNGVTDKMKYSFGVNFQNVKLGIRLRSQYIEIDSLYIQPNYKHDLSFDLNNLPLHSKLQTANEWWSQEEMKRIEGSMWMMQNNYYNNNSWLWQGDRVVKLKYDRQHIAGPFRANSFITFFNEKKFDIDFNFEPGYEYNISKQVVRLEKKSIFPQKNNRNYLPVKNVETLLLGDTLITAPEIFYPAEEAPVPRINISKEEYSYLYSSKSGNGQLLIKLHDTIRLKYIILENRSKEKEPVVLPGRLTRIYNISPGKYNLLLVNHNNETFVENAVEIMGDTTSCIKINIQAFQKNNILISRLIAISDSINNPIPDTTTRIKAAEKQPAPFKTESMLVVKKGGRVEGTIKDARGGIGIPFATVSFMDYKHTITADAGGNFIFNNIRPGKYILLVTAVGYSQVKIVLNIWENSRQVLNVKMESSTNALEEVVVTALGIQRQRKDLGYSTVKVSGKELTAVNMANGLQGKVSGLNVTSVNNGVFEDPKINLRGIRSLAGNSNPLYVVDGIIYKSIQHVDPALIADVTILTASDAIALYGPSASDGAVVITTKTKTERKIFRDYAFWEPNFFTNKNGEAALKVTYPDNITAWKTFIVGMDRKRRIGKTSFLTQAYKPMLAQLNLPLFLIEGDECNFVTKSINYTADAYSVKTIFNLNGQASSEKQFELKPNDAMTREETVKASTDTLTASFALNSSTGFKDMEERKIPVFKKGLEQSEGAFYVLKNDTTIHFSAQRDDGSLNIYAQNNTLDLLLEELDHLRKYPYFCVEQMTSKFNGLAMEKEIRELTKEPFKGQKEMERLLRRIQKAQHFDGGWPWWEGGNSNLQITNYITKALLSLRKDPLVETNVRNAVLYLSNKLPFLEKADLLATITTLNDARHEMDYTGWLRKVKFDSLSQHQQWQWVKIMQQQKLDYKKQLQYLIDKKTATMLGGIHWGEDNYLWYSNNIATTIIALEVLQKEDNTGELVNGILQWFLEMKRGGYWRNTVESATILNAVLPMILHEQKNFNSPANIRVAGDTSFTINNFPYEVKLKTTGVKNISIRKEGGGMVYFTAYQTWFNPTPKVDSSSFVIQTIFEKNGKEIQTIQSGEKIKMIVKINVLKDADYVMITMPIPAGCIFTDKNTSWWGNHKEYYKDKMMIYAERLPKGSYAFEATLEPRYNGTFHLNPAKAELMYYPVFSGNNEMKSIRIAAP